MTDHRLTIALACLALCAAGSGCSAPDLSTDGVRGEPRISASLASTQPDASHRFPVLVRLTNTGSAEAVVFRPLDGSLNGWHMPHYRFTVRTPEGVELPLPGRCGVSGLWAGTVWPDSYAVMLAPNESLELKLSVPQVWEPGTYHVRFVYEYRTDPGAQWQLPMPPGAWIGAAEAPELVVSFPELRPGS